MKNGTQTEASLTTAELMAAMLHTESAEETGFYAQKSRDALLTEKKVKVLPCVPKMNENTLQFEPVLLRSALFRPGKGPREFYRDYTVIPSSGTSVIALQGEELRQDDQRVLLALLKVRSGSKIDTPIELVLRTFCRDALGWSDGSDSVEKLKACLKRLHSANVQVTYREVAMAERQGKETPNFGMYYFISNVKVTGSKYVVTLDPEFANMFFRTMTFLAQDVRLSLGDGFTSWLWAYVKAHPFYTQSGKEHPIALSNLKEQACKSGFTNKAFNFMVAETVAELAGLGLVEGLEFVNLGSGKGRGLLLSR